MKIFILADAEGISGVVSMELQSKPGSIGYAEMRSLLMSDLNAAIEGALSAAAQSAGAKEIVVYDMHYYGLNIIIEEIHPEATVVLGKPPKVKPQVRKPCPPGTVGPFQPKCRVIKKPGGANKGNPFFKKN